MIARRISGLRPVGSVALALVLVLTAPVARAEVDLNRATLEEIKTLPVSEEIAVGIWEHREYVDYFQTTIELLQVPGITPEILADAAHEILTRPSREATGNFYIDDEVLAEAGVTDLSGYAYVPDAGLQRDIFLDEERGIASG